MVPKPKAIVAHITITGWIIALATNNSEKMNLQRKHLKTNFLFGFY